jgi:cobalt-zinc-cadmium efflux system membrane fusion protein
MVWRVRPHWATVVLAVLVIAAAALAATGRLQLRWGAGSPPGLHDGHDHSAEGNKGQEEESRVSGDKAIFDAEALRAAGFRSAPAEKGSIGVQVQATGEVQVPDDRQAHVTPRISGVVRDIQRARGEIVAAGAPLAVIESAELGEAKAAYVAALADLTLAEANVGHWRRQRDRGFTADDAPPVGWLELGQALAEHASARTDHTIASQALVRVKQLHDRGLRSGTEVIAAEAEARRAAGRVDVALQRLKTMGAVAETEASRARQRRDAAISKLRALSLDDGEIKRLETDGGRDVTSRFVVRSPIAGMVAERNLTLGETVEATARIFSITDLREVWVRAALFDKDVGAVRQGMPATIRVQGIPKSTFQGRVRQLGPQVDEKTRTFPVRIAVTNRALNGTAEPFALRPGMFATLDIETSRRPGAVVVPTSAVQTVAGQTVVFVETALTEGAAFQRRPVVLGARDEKVVEVVEGLQPGERVVVGNAYLLKSEFERSKISHGHAH